jgi:ribokinase
MWVAGSINMDIVVSAQRRPMEGETVIGDRVGFLPGGKGANQAVAGAHAGASVALVGAVGMDAFGEQMSRFLRSEGVDTTHVIAAEGVATGMAHIVVDGKGENSIIVVPGANGVWAIDAVDVPLAAGDVVLAQLEIPHRNVERWLERGREAGSTTMLNAAPAQQGADRLFSLADVVVVNEVELSFFSSRRVGPHASTQDVIEAALALKRRDDQTMVATLGRRGAVAVGPEGVIVVEGREVTVVDTTGAGDCFAGTMAAQLVAGHTMRRAVDFANVAASICVQRMGAGISMPSAAKVDEVIAARG